MQPGADLQQVFTRLCQALSQLSASLPFEADPRYGYLTSCPSNLGTALRASVHISLPLLS